MSAARRTSPSRGVLRRRASPAGVARAAKEGLIPAADAPDLLVIAAVWVAWTADDEDAVFAQQPGRDV